MNPGKTMVGGDPLQTVVTVTNNGKPFTPDSISYGSSAPAVATVDPNTGVVSPGTDAGTALITASWTGTSNGQPVSGSKSAPVEVAPQADNFDTQIDFAAVAAPAPSPAPASAA